MPILFALRFCTYTMLQSHSAPSATLMVMMRELRVREEVLRTGTTSRGNRQLRRPCSIRVCPGH
eukprot:4837175-Prymnesium_polylepis.1